MSKQQPQVGDFAKYLVKNSKGATAVVDAILIGFGATPAGYDGQFPPAYVAFIDPARVAMLSGASWRQSFDRAIDVPHASSSTPDRHMYVIPEDVAEVRNGLLVQLKKAQDELATAKAAHKPGVPELVAPVVPITPAPAKK